MRWPLLTLVVPALAGCSLIYNPNNLPEPRMIDAAVIDSNPCALGVMDIAPSSIDEGAGDGGSLPALLVVHGRQLISPRVEITAPAGVTVHLEPVTGAVASGDNNYLAFAVTAHVDTALKTDVRLDVVVTQDCATTATLSGQLRLHGLPELASGGPEFQSGKLMAERLATRYSRVNLMDLASLTLANENPASPSPVLITAVSSITTGALVADASLAAAGPGGYPGSAGVGGGPAGGGVGLTPQVTGNGGGGGGAGFAADGHAGANGTGGASGGAAGRRTGTELIVPLDANQPSAGGGGGAGSLLGGAAGGVGGGGGGIVALLAGGDLTTGTISAIGGQGDKGKSGLGSGGGGGGGAGGAVIVSSASGSLRVGRINVTAGPAGSPGGGAGSVGRVRWDAIATGAPSSPDRMPHRGPVFAVTDRLFTMPSPTLTLLGTHDDGFTIRVTDQQHVVHDGGHATFGSDNTAMINPALYPGYNQVCITLDGGVQGRPESDRCLDVAYLPPR